MGTDDCTPWPRGRTRSGYGRTSVDGREEYVHRLVWANANGPIPRGMVVMHTCDNPPCVNLAHLRLGTHADNCRDKIAKGRAPHGDDHWSRRLKRGGNERLTAEQVLEIRAARANGVGQRVLAERYGVSPETVGNIHRRISWKHL